jgi:type II secretory pathway component PulK
MEREKFNLKKQFPFLWLIKKGTLLFFSLWILSFLSILVLYLGWGARQKLLVLKKLADNHTLRLIGKAGIEKAILELSKDNTPLKDSFLEEWANQESIFKEVKIGLGKFSVCYNYLTQGEEKTIYGIVDEARKININNADLKTIKRLLKVVLDIDDIEAQNLAASIVDFIDQDSNLSIPLGSAEDSYYHNLKEPYECKDDKLEVLEELLLVKGIDKVTFEKLKKFVTIYDEAVNINTASYEVLYALEIEERVIDKIINYRKGEDGMLGTLDDNVFNSPASIVSQLSQYSSLSSSEVANLSNLVAEGKLTTFSNYFTIEVKAELNYSKTRGKIICVVDRKGKILYWREI